MHNHNVSFCGELKQVLLDIEAHCSVEYDGRMLESMTEAMLQRAAADGLTYHYVIPPEGYADTACADFTCIHYGWFYPAPTSALPELHIYLWKYQDSSGQEQYANRRDPCCSGKKE
ncbi:MAG: hypothetical protein MJ014_00025 [Methanocorpusculum sp.]|nr:hypothetical protein [Methanocorpusculum sp.]